MRRQRRREVQRQIVEAEQETLTAQSDPLLEGATQRSGTGHAPATSTPPEMEPDFAVEPLGLPDSDALDEEDATYFPPTDPVVAPGPTGQLEVVGGFSATSMDLVDEGAGGEVAGDTVEGEEPLDEALAEAVRQALRRDALTTDLSLEVAARDGIAYLFGSVASQVEAEDAEAVAALLPGVREVVVRLRWD